MEVIIIITKEVPDQAAAETFTANAKNFIANTPPLNDPSVRTSIETRDQLDGT